MKKIKAEKMFEKLGYIRVPGKDDDEIVYYNKDLKKSSFLAKTAL